MNMPSLLAPYAATPETSRGRLHPESPDHYRTAFQRDRDRIIHAAAFRRLQNKTQVFVAHEGDHYRTRLTHTLEVAQIARNIARALQVNEDLAETIALAHDLGHPPFAHKGEDVLAECMAPYGGFLHNDQTVRVVTVLERPYMDWPGLNLSVEAIEGVVKHNGPALTAQQGMGELPFTIRELSQKIDLRLRLHAGVEAQIVDVADDTAYCAHDVEDGLRAGFFTLDELEALKIFEDILPPIRARAAEVGPPLPSLIRAMIRAQLTVMVGDILDTARANLAALAPASSDEVRAAGRQMVQFSPALFSKLKELRAFLMGRMYRHYTVRRSALKAERILSELFHAFMQDPSLLPTEWAMRVARQVDEAARARSIVDYVAGMTDMYAIKEYHRLFDFNIDFK